MKREITIGQLLAACVAIIISLATGWLTTQKRMAIIEEKQRQTEMQMMDDRIQYRAAINDLKWQVTEGNKDIRNILIEMQHKANKK